MDQKDTFQTISYKGAHIHLCQNQTSGKEEIKTQIKGKTFPCQSLLGAKRAITKALT